MREVFTGMNHSARVESAKIKPQNVKRLSTTVIEAIAEKEGIDITDVGPLYNVIDLEALNALFPRRLEDDSIGRVIFEHNGYEIEVLSTGDVEISEVMGNEND